MLQRRIASLQQNESNATCLVLDAMVPRQQLTLRIDDRDWFAALKELRVTGKPLAMLGIDPATRTLNPRNPRHFDSTDYY